MMEFQEKRKIRKIIYSKITLVVLLVISFFILKGVWNVYKKQETSRDNLIKTKENLDNLREREKMLSSEIERLKTVSGQEEEIRVRYGLVKPGEEVLVIVDGEEGDGLKQYPVEESFLQKVIKWFK